MPVGIDQVGDGLVRLGVQFLDMGTVHVDRASVGSSHVEDHPGRILHPERVAVDTIVVRQTVFIDRSLLE